MMTKQDEIIAEMGFEVCEFGPESGAPCERCNTDEVQLYFQGPTDAGRYYCRTCIIVEHTLNNERLSEIEVTALLDRIDDILTQLLEVAYRLPQDHPAKASLEAFAEGATDDLQTYRASVAG